MIWHLTVWINCSGGLKILIHQPRRVLDHKNIFSHSRIEQFSKQNTLYFDEALALSTFLKTKNIPFEIKFHRLTSNSTFWYLVTFNSNKASIQIFGCLILVSLIGSSLFFPMEQNQKYHLAASEEGKVSILGVESLSVQ